MKLELEIFDDQIELLQKFKTLPKMVEEHIGLLPQSFPGSTCELQRIKELCEILEFRWKKWVINSLIQQCPNEELFKDIVVAKSGEYLDGYDL